MHLRYNLSQESNVTAGEASRLRYALDYQITFDPQVMVNMTEVSGSISRLRLNQAMSWIQGYLISYLDPSGIPVPTTLFLKNYYLSIFPAL